MERRERFERARRESFHQDDDKPVVLYGWHAVCAALRNPNRQIRKFLATENAARRLLDEEISPNAPPEIVRPSAIIERLLPDTVHQGVYLETEPLPAPALEDLPPKGVVLVLDQITDPHNVGAILRSAAAFNVGAIISTQRHSAGSTAGALAKAASGALEYVPLINVQNLARGLTLLKGKGFLLVGLDSDGEKELAVLSLRSPLALVLGAEGKGLRALTKASCDHLARIDLPGAIKSLNVSNAAALALYVTNQALSGE
jgi:23S rRNA (guanosine2251-2'-O)-methyltransferase